MALKTAKRKMQVCSTDDLDNHKSILRLYFWVIIGNCVYITARRTDVQLKASSHRKRKDDTKKLLVGQG